MTAVAESREPDEPESEETPDVPDTKTLPLFPEVTEPSQADDPPTREELDSSAGITPWVPPAAAHSFELDSTAGTLTVRCESTGSELVMETDAGYSAKCQGCGFELTVRRLPLGGEGVAAVDAIGDVQLVERDQAEQAIIAAAVPRPDLFAPTESPRDAEPAVVDLAQSRERILRDIRKRTAPMVQIGRYAVPTEWVRMQADPGCTFGCGGEGYVVIGGKAPEFCRCALVRAKARIADQVREQSLERVNLPANVRTVAESERLKKTAEALTRQVREAEGALAIRDTEHARQVNAIADFSSETIGDLETEARRQAAAAQDAESALIIAKSKATTYRELVARTLQKLGELQSELAGAEVKILDAQRDAEVASTLATEAGQRLAGVSTKAETETARLSREHEKRTAGARAELAKLKRRLALAEARR